MKPVFDHDKLIVYQRAIAFVAWAEGVLADVAKTLAVHGQLDRASTSVVLNIAEGNGKYSMPDRCRFLDIARGSAVECAACLDVLVAKRRITEARGLFQDQGIPIVIVLVVVLVIEVPRLFRVGSRLRARLRARTTAEDQPSSEILKQPCGSPGA